MIKHILYKLKRPYHFIKTGLLNGLLAEIKYKHPAKKLKVITITGTDGKTTSSTLLYHVLKSANKKVGLLSTVAAYLGNKSVSTGFHVTSPQPKDLQKFMSQMVNKKYEYLVLEVTSHGDYQYRTWGVTPIISGLTNISNEHLDYHLTYDEYLSAKLNILKKAPISVVNSDDRSYLHLIKKMANTNLVTYSKETILPKKVQAVINKVFPEDYNQMNAKLVYALAKSTGVSDTDFVSALKTFKGIPGRMEKVKNSTLKSTNKKLNIIVDFAHTPQGLKSVLRSLKEKMEKENKVYHKGIHKINSAGREGALGYKNSKLIAVFGCAGKRDIGKRPMMGKIATELADFSVFTAEDPRDEDIWSIIRQMKEQLTTGHNKVISIAERGEAIEYAITKLANQGDTVVILGKGHEKSMNYDGIEYPWNDIEAVEEILKGKHPRVK
jgi:UDP-N-acetylmuramoyl-L-alanyl-D-glutamate--2,6-diaminopimelate ligase